MAFIYYVGWDTSKASLNYCIRNSSQTIVREGEVDNNAKKLWTLLKEWNKSFKAEFQDFLHCVENTGHYCNPMLSLVQEFNLRLWLEDPFQLSRSVGRQRDKTDSIDARKIAEYCVVWQRKAKLYSKVSELEIQLDLLSKLRLQLVRMRQSLSTSFKEKSKFSLVQMDDVQSKATQAIINTLDTEIKAIEQRVHQIIQADEETKRIYEIALSVPGIGKKNILVILTITGMFKKITTAKACASYAGVSPHQHLSGSSIKKRSRVSRAANRELKTALHQGAAFLICRPSPFKDLYDRLRKKGRSYRQAINAVRNKMINVLYACLKNNTTYDKKIHQSFA